jgi:hypothetical protein
MRDFFSSHIRNPNSRRAYREAVRQFSAFCAEHGIVDLAKVEPIHVAAFVEAQLKLHSRPTVKTATSRVAHALRLDGGRPDPARQSRACRSWAEALATTRQDTGAAGRRSPDPDRCDRHHFPARPARPCSDRLDGLHLRARGRSRLHEGRGLLCAGTAQLGAAA